ncbi:ABC transporter permease [Leadbettera azotonutricia]|uniref:Putative lipoprotein releasing system, permease protein n=1 Tax=Leadbettera azotonutricia (strain ATCC BAA-888 / DSM 13862 / ZAS-9) TaxID=545695 RepID=F5YG62_LEAAZ|nr:ABC transporter permease [Leadbettera azotonutricia]AEF80079.1 putative lipoprotein releasing system, permease protein [Leadbettera azotonutricia ZAS-9]
MKAGAAFFIALRYLLGRAREGGRYLRGAAGGIALSLIPIVVTLIVADGMIRGITDRYIELGTGHLQIYNYAHPLDPEEPSSLIKNTAGIKGAWAEKHGLGVLVGNKGSRGATIRAVDNSFWEDEGSQKYLETISGESRISDDKDVLLGEELAKSIGAEAGSTVRIMTIRVTADGRNMPRVTVFTVRGIISSGYRDLDSLWCVMNTEAGQRILPDTSASYLMLKIDDPYNGADSMAALLSRTLGSGYGIYTWKQLQRSQYSSYESTRQLLLFIMALIVMVAAVNVSSATSMLAIERQRDIAVLKASGANPGFTSGIFLWGAFLTGLAGSVIGIAAGLLIGASVNELVRGLESFLSFFSRFINGEPVKILDSGYYLEKIPIIIDRASVFLIGLFTVLSSVLASWIPARRAGKLKPIEIMRKY